MRAPSITLPAYLTSCSLPPPPLFALFVRYPLFGGWYFGGNCGRINPKVNASLFQKRLLWSPAKADPPALPPPLTVHTFASHLANVCSWHSITNISFGFMQIWRRLWQLLSQSAPKSMLEFCVLPQGSLLLIFVLPSLCIFGHVILKSISNRVATPSSSPLPSLLCFGNICAWKSRTCCQKMGYLNGKYGKWRETRRRPLRTTVNIAAKAVERAWHTTHTQLSGRFVAVKTISKVVNKKKLRGKKRGKGAPCQIVMHGYCQPFCLPRLSSAARNNNGNNNSGSNPITKDWHISSGPQMTRNAFRMHENRGLALDFRLFDYARIDVSAMCVCVFVCTHHNL